MELKIYLQKRTNWEDNEDDKFARGEDAGEKTGQCPHGTIRSHPSRGPYGVRRINILEHQPGQSRKTGQRRDYKEDKKDVTSEKGTEGMVRRTEKRDSFNEGDQREWSGGPTRRYLN